ncbi:MAG: type II secretion system protein [Rickettsiales bacterium]
MQHPSTIRPRPSGFSLVELSIVLVILGLLVGGILMGRSLIRSSEMRAVVTEYNKYMAAVINFQDQYSELPGDMSSATSYWGKDNTNCAGHSGAAATPGTCNGNNNGRMNLSAAASQTGETYRFWQHLQLAGLIEGSFTGVAGPLDVYDMIVGVNIPRSRAGNAAWGVREYEPMIAAWSNTSMFDLQYGNWLQFGADPFTDNGGGVLTPQEAWNLDVKMDDGMPASGSVIVRHWSPCSSASAYTDLNVTYKQTSQSRDCVLMFPNAF